MADCNIRNIDESLMRAMKAEAAKAGLTLRDWVIGGLAKLAGWEVGRAVEVQARGMQAAEREIEEESKVEECPDCAGAMVWNRTMRRWQCPCGYIGKTQI